MSSMRKSARIASRKRPTYKEEAVTKSAVISAKKKAVKKPKTLKKEAETAVAEDTQKASKQEKVELANGTGKFVGAHTSISGGVWKAAESAAEIGAKAFGLFLRNQQQWKIKPMVEGHAERFKEACEKYGYKPQFIVPHGSYLMNCGSFKEDVREKSREMLVEELKRCEALGLLYFNFHPGSTLGKMPISKCVSYVADAINNAHSKTKYAVAVLENMSCQGNTIGGKLGELRDIIQEVEDKSRVGVCIDTCHAHAAGYDLSTEKGYVSLMNDLEQIIGFKYLKAIHLNDSKGPVGCHLDRHENIGRGTIGIAGFNRIMNDPRLDGIPMILETPPQLDDEAEIKILYSLQENN